jgi:hypothetical protein
VKNIPFCVGDDAPLLPISVPQDVPADDPLGLDSWANAYGLAPHTALALAAGLLAGIAGPLARLPAQAPCTFPAANMAGRENDAFLRMAADSLLEWARPCEAGLIKKSLEISAEEMDAAMFEAGRRRLGDDLGKLGDPDPLQPRDFSSLQRLRDDAVPSDQIIRYEALARARFLVSGRVSKSLASLLTQYHFGHGLLAGATETLHGDGSKRNSRLDEYIRCFAGTEASPAPAAKRHKIASETVCLKGLLLFPPDQFDWLVTNRRSFLSHAIPVASSPDAGLDQVDEFRAAEFTRNFELTAMHALASRRVHAAVVKHFSTEALLIDFGSKQRAFLRELREIPENLSVTSAASLPVTMAWALLLLAGRRDLDRYIVEKSFASARKVVDDARSLFVRFDQAALGAARLRNARKILNRLAEKGPSPRWDLLRGLDQQSVKIHGPVIRVLIELQIIRQDGDNLLHLGSVPAHRLSVENLIGID